MDINNATLERDEQKAFGISLVYEKKMGIYQTSVQDGQKVDDIPGLSYIDIMPRCLDVGNLAEKVLPKFDTFSSILDGANLWLKDHPGLFVLKCESVEKTISLAKDGTIVYHLSDMCLYETNGGNTVYMLLHETDNRGTVYVKGIRLWLVKNPRPGSPVQQLGVKNVVPADLTIELPTHGQYMSGRLVISHEVRMLGGLHPFHTFEGMEDTMTRLKALLQEEPLPGKILNIETDHIKTRQRLTHGLNAESTCWLDGKDTWFRSTQVVRIYYVTGPQAMEDVGYQEFVPEITEQPEGSKPGQFEPFDSLVEKLGEWASKHPDINIVNIQHYDATAHLSHVGTSLYVSSDSTDHVINTTSERRMARTLRVFYVTSPVSLNLASTIRCRLFLPPRTGPKSFETMNQTMERINAWLQATGLSVFSVETVPILIHEKTVSSSDYKLSEYTVPAEPGKHWLTGIRLYFTTNFTEPDTSLLPPVPEYHHGLHGPEHCLLL